MRLCLIAALVIGAGIPSGASADPKTRNEYRAALEQLRSGQLSRFKRSQAQLKDYVLAPYLEYHRLRTRISAVNNRNVIRFIETHPELPATPILHRRWLRQLGSTRQWQTFLDNYPADAFGPQASASLDCYYLRSLYGTNKRAQALAQTGARWSVGQSQPKACDPLFEVWRQSEHFDQDIVWLRLGRALAANEVTLARYLLRYFTGANKRAADAYYQVHVSPSRLRRAANYRIDTERGREAIVHGFDIIRHENHFVSHVSLSELLESRYTIAKIIIK